MTAELYSVFLYVAAFGFSDMIVKYFSIHSTKSLLCYYSIILLYLKKVRLLLSIDIKCI